MLKTSIKRVIRFPTPEENAKIIAGAKADPDASLLTKAQLKAMVPMHTLRGRPKLENKKLLVSVRYSPEVLDYFRATGAGWQARMDGVLRQHIGRQRARAKAA